jgi:hypothetical protein
MATRPRAVVCHICGRQYGTTSIDIHLVMPRVWMQGVSPLNVDRLCPQKTCVKMWEAQEAQKPKHLRRPVPQAPEIPAAIASGVYKAPQDAERLLRQRHRCVLSQVARR